MKSFQYGIICSFIKKSLERMGTVKKFDVIGIGAIAVDFLGMVPSFPSPDTKNRMIELIRQGGGPVATALVALARLGAMVSFLGKLGDDELSRFLLEEFQKEGVDTSGIVHKKGAGPYFAFVIVEKDSGSRTIWWTDQMVYPLEEEEVSKEFITSGKILHIDEYELKAALRGVRSAREAGMKVVLDAESPGKKELLPVINLVNFLIVPEEFALGFSGCKNIEDAADFFLKRGPEAIIITQGIRGCYCKTPTKHFHQKAFRINVVDTTGCGDVFHGGFIFGLLNDWPLEITAEFASAVAALKCRKLGGRAGCPTFEEVKEFLKKRGSEKIREIL